MQALSVKSNSLQTHVQAEGRGRVIQDLVCVLQVQRQTEEENAAAEAEQLHLQEEEWNMAELERIQEQQVGHLALLHNMPKCLAACLVEWLSYVGCVGLLKLLTHLLLCVSPWC